MTTNPEYLRRNLLHMKALGAHASARHALKRVQDLKHPPKWLVGALTGIVERVEPLGPALACYRSVVPRDLPSSDEVEYISDKSA